MRLEGGLAVGVFAITDAGGFDEVIAEVPEDEAEFGHVEPFQGGTSATRIWAFVGLKSEKLLMKRVTNQLHARNGRS